MWSATPLFADDNWAWQSHCPTCTCRSILPSATFGYWSGGVLSQYGEVMRYLWPIKIWSDSWPKRADSSLMSSRNTGFPPPQRIQLREIAEATPHLQLTHSISAVVILAQIRSMVADLMELTGMEYVEARELIPGMD